MRKFPILALLICSSALAQDDPVWRSWNQPVEPFRIAGNIYYVGANEITSFLITTPKGHILLDGGFKETAPMILANIERLGFRPSDVRVLLSSHAHFDHAGGLAELKRVTGAKFYASAGDLPVLARGGLDDPQFGDKYPFPPVEADRVVRDGERIALDGTELTAHITAGHTRGCTTYTMRVRDRGEARNVVFFCSPSVPSEYKLVGNAKYPDVVSDYRKHFATLEKLDCDVPLAAHGTFFSLEEKRKQLAADPKSNPFIDPKGCRDMITTMKTRFEAELAKQTK
jgi:metallo-beta-lactamase class B